MRFDLDYWSTEIPYAGQRPFLDHLVEAEALGFAGVWFSEFHFRPDDPYPAPLLLAAGILARTERLRVGTSVTPIGLYHPLLLAEAVMQLDAQSGGRFDFGIGRGTDARVFSRLGIDPDSRHARFADALAILYAAWTTGRADARDATWTFEDTAFGPTPADRLHPPFLIASGAADTVDLALRYRLPMLFIFGHTPDEAANLARLHATAPRALLRRSSVTRHVLVGESEAEVRRLAETLLPALNSEQATRAARQGRDPAGIAPLDYDAFVATRAIAGTPQMCIAQIRALASALGTDTLRLTFSSYGRLPVEHAIRAMRLFAREVMPAF